MCSFSISAISQQFAEDFHPHEEDTLIKISTNNSEPHNWNFSGLNSNNYPNTSDVDLKQIQNLENLLTTTSLLGENDSIIGNLPDSSFTYSNLNFKISGTYSLKLGERGNLTTPNNQIFFNAKEVMYNEKYYLLNEKDSLISDTVAFYNNNYFSFVKDSTNQIVFETFKKSRSLSVAMNWEFVGISKCFDCQTMASLPDIELSLTPNPSIESTLISFLLPVDTPISIFLTNQENTVNLELFNGNLNQGFQELQFITQDFTTGTYLLKIETSFGQYSEVLIIL
jgi:hypothetical protein